MGATPQAGVFHRRHHLRPLRRRGADRRQHRGTHRHPRHPRPLRETRRAGRSALPALSARTACGGCVTICRPRDRGRNLEDATMRPRARRTALGLLPGIGEKSPGTAPLRRSAKPKTPRAHRRSESQPALARPWPARQTGSKGRLKFLYPLERYFHYRNLDVSTLKELARRWAPGVLAGFDKQSAHTALSDVRDSIAELRHYRQHLAAFSA